MFPGFSIVAGHMAHEARAAPAGPQQKLLGAPRMRLLTINETAALCRVRPITVRRWIATGQLAASKVGGQWRIHESTVHQLTGASTVDDIVAALVAQAPDLTDDQVLVLRRVIGAR